MRAALALVMLSLAACSEPAPPAQAPAAPAEPVMLGGVDLNQPLRVLGTEPFWSVEMTPEALVYSTPEGEGLRSSNPGPTVQGTTAVYAAATADGTALVVTLIATECSDGMSDRVYPLTARVEAANETLNGCAAPIAQLNSSPAP
ncbi:COG3650 family protein [Brevundimonas sp. R86498]|uniref:COG3650 family protein n=1 Tax=Brevundimonas sp. R86498 TaxID=3093845 RepID=UPI0037C8426B